MKKLLISLCLVAPIKGCVLNNIVETGAEANDQMLVNAEKVICRAASVGAIERRYNSKQLLKARETICNLQRIEK